MTLFPRTDVGGLSVSRLIVGTNWFLGWSHASDAKDLLIRDVVTERTRIAEILTAFFEAGVDTVMGPFPHAPLLDAVHDAEDRSGVRAIIVSTPTVPVGPDVPAKGFDREVVARLLDEQAEIGTRICMPHQSTTDSLVDRCTRTIRHADTLLAMIRERGMIPGVATHMPETLVYADETGLDVGDLRLHLQLRRVPHADRGGLDRADHRPCCAGTRRPSNQRLHPTVCRASG